MPDSIDPTPTEPSSLARAAALDGAAQGEADDLALGWECANPLLQIERWQQEAGGDVH